MITLIQQGLGLRPREQRALLIRKMRFLHIPVFQFFNEIWVGIFSQQWMIARPALYKTKQAAQCVTPLKGEVIMSENNNSITK